MTRGVTTLETMVRDLRLETGRNPNRNVGKDEYDSLAYIIRRTQRVLYEGFTWPFLRVRVDIPLVQGQRYYDVPSSINFDRIISFRGDGNEQWKKIHRGIDMYHYDLFDSDEGETSYPVERWDLWDTGSGEQLEFWPMPDQSGETIRIRAYRKLGDLISDNDVCTLDPDLIVLYAAAEVLSSQDREKSRKKMGLADKLFRDLKGNAISTEDGSFKMGGGDPLKHSSIHENAHILAVKSPNNSS